MAKQASPRSAIPSLRLIRSDPRSAAVSLYTYLSRVAVHCERNFVVDSPMVRFDSSELGFSLSVWPAGLPDRIGCFYIFAFLHLASWPRPDHSPHDARNIRFSKAVKYDLKP